MSFKPLHFVAKRVPGGIENRTVNFIMSREDEDRAGDTVAADGWQLRNYEQNPVVLWCHDSHKPPIGKCVSIGVQGKALVGAVQFATADVNPFADVVYRLVEAGFVNAGSVGFRPVRWEINDKGGLDYKEQELLEFSVVGVPCHPGALAQVRSLGMSLDDAAPVFTDPHNEDAARAAYLEDARNRAASSLAKFKRAYDVRVREFQLGR